MFQAINLISLSTNMRMWKYSADVSEFEAFVRTCYCLIADSCGPEDDTEYYN